jgi:hypothetical protein
VRRSASSKIPLAARVEPDDALHPPRAVEIRPLIREAEVALDDAAADGLEIHQARVAGEMLPRPVTEDAFEIGARLGEHGPVVEEAVGQRRADRVAPPHGLAADERDVRAHVLAGEKPHPHVAGRQRALVLGARPEHASPEPMPRRL